MTDMENYVKQLEETVEKFGAPLRELPIESAIKFISDYEVASSEVADGMKILKLVKKG